MGSFKLADDGGSSRRIGFGDQNTWRFPPERVQSSECGKLGVCDARLDSRILKRSSYEMCGQVVFWTTDFD
jgi:hypothetical protein